MMPKRMPPASVDLDRPAGWFPATVLVTVPGWVVVDELDTEVVKATTWSAEVATSSPSPTLGVGK
jgi:hypothetical protein